MSNVFVYGTLMAEEVVDVLIRRQPKKVPGNVYRQKSVLSTSRAFLRQALHKAKRHMQQEYKDIGDTVSRALCSQPSYLTAIPMRCQDW